MTMDQYLLADLQQRRRANLYRTRQVLESPQGVRVIFGGRSYLSFSSNDYLGLASHPDVIKRLQQATAESGVGSGASHLINGHAREHHALEEELAAFTGRPRALLFSTGYMANLGIMDALLSTQDSIIQDRLSHASLLDGGRLCGAQFLRYQHADPNSLATQLQRAAGKRKLIATDGVFSMDGDLAPLPQLVSIAQRHCAWLMVDDAHGFGVLGPNGGGCAEYFGLNCNDLPVLMGTLGKGFGAFGAFVAGSEALIEYLIQFSRTYIYTTALPPAIAAATRASLALLQQESWRRDKLAALTRQFRQGAAQLGLQLLDSATPIQPVILGDEARTLAVSSQLRQNGFLVGAIRPPTVAKGSSRLRITLSAEHSEAQLNQLLNALSRAVADIPEAAP